MQAETRKLLHEDPKMAGYLKQNSQWYKHLNRDPNNYEEFKKQMKDKYKTNITDKIESAIDNIDIVTGILNVLK